MASSSVTESVASSDDDASRAFMTLVAALQSDGHMPDMENIKDFIFSTGMFGMDETANAAELNLP